MYYISSVRSNMRCAVRHIFNHSLGADHERLDAAGDGGGNSPIQKTLVESILQ